MQGSNRQSYRRSVDDVLKQADAFGRPLPMFNINGKEKVQTWTGGLLTLSIILGTFVFALHKF